jgi:hypothetical protein
LWDNIEVSDYQIAIKQKEFNLLYKLLKLNKNEEDQFKKALLLYTSIRKYRESLMSSKAIALENSMEWQEGVAQFIDSSIKQIVEGNKGSISSLLNDYGLKFNKNVNNSAIDHFMRWQAYYHGAAICYLLSNISPSWQTEIEQGKTPFEILEQTVGSTTLSDLEIEKILNIDRSQKTQVNNRETYTQLESWKYTLVITHETQSPTFKAQSLDSFENGILVKKVDQLNFENEMISIYGRPISLFLETQKKNFENKFYLKIKKIPKPPKMCQQTSNTQWQCQAGAKIKISSLKIKIKQDLTINIVDGVMSFNTNQQ